MKQYMIIGCGRFGASVAETLTDLGNQVMVMDKNEEALNSIVEKVTNVVIGDASDEKVLRSLGLGNFDVVIMAIGSNIKGAIMSTLIAKESGAKYVICKAQDDVSAMVLLKVGADRVVMPEKDMGRKVALNLESHNVLDQIELNREYAIFEIEVPSKWVNHSIVDLNLRQEYNITVIAVKRGEKLAVNPDPSIVIEKGDIFVIVGNTKFIKRIESLNV